MSGLSILNTEPDWFFTKVRAFEYLNNYQGYGACTAAFLVAEHRSM